MTTNNKHKDIFLYLLCIIAAASLYLVFTQKEQPDLSKTALAFIEKSNAPLKRVDLSNGTICLIKEDHSAPVAAIQIWVGTGAIHESEFLGSGLSHAIEHMIFKGTENMSPSDLVKAINDAGGRINAYTGFDRTVFHTDIPSKNWKIGFNVLSDSIMNASFPADEWEKEKNVILREIDMGKDSPERVMNKLLWRTAYHVHPYKHPVIGYEDTFKSISREDIVEFFTRHYVPDNMIVVVVGDIDTADAEETIKDRFSSFPRKSRAPVILPIEPTQISARTATVQGAYQKSRLQWAYHTVPLNHQDAVALDILSSIMGNGRSSKLAQKFKEDLKLVHSIDAWSWTPKESGLFGVSAEFKPENKDILIAAIEEEIESWTTSLISESDIQKAKRMIITSELAEFQTMNGQAHSYASGQFYAGDAVFSETYIKQLSNITPESLREVAKKYLRTNNRTITILEPAIETKKDDKKSDLSEAVNKPVQAQKVSGPNNIPIITRPDHKLPFVYFSVAFRGGLLSEDSSNIGITRLMTEMLRRGTATMTNDEMARIIDEAGGSLSTFSGRNSFGINARCMTDDADLFMSIIADCLTSPLFSQAEIDKEITLQIAAIEERKERPFTIAHDALQKTIFEGHPYAWSELGTLETVTAINRSMLLSHFNKAVVTGNMVVSIFGDITTTEAEELAQRHLKSIKKGNRPEHMQYVSTPDLPSHTKQRIPKQQAIILAGFPGVTVKDDRADALELLKTAMSGLSSNLGLEVREKRGLVYYVGAFQRSGIDAGMFMLYAGTSEDNVAEIEELMEKEIKRLTTTGLSEEEFLRARNQIIANYEMSLQNNLSIAMTCALNELYGLEYKHLFNTKERFEALTRDDILKTVQSVFIKNKKAVSLVLPEKRQGE